MKRFAIIILILLLGGITSESFAQKKGRVLVYFQSDMDCGECENTLYEHLKFEKGVKDLKIDHISNTILIEYVEKKNDEKGLAAAIVKKAIKLKKLIVRNMIKSWLRLRIRAMNIIMRFTKNGIDM